MPDQRQNSALIVLGMHRSGTSALTGVLSMAGANPGLALMPAVEGANPKGFWEHQDIVAIHERLLASLGSSWHDERPLPDNWWQQQDVACFRADLLTILRRDFSFSPLWILKDPRLCRLLPFWLEILRDFGTSPNFVICLRHPSEVARSLEQRDGIPAARSSLLWLEHLIESERWTRGLPRIMVTYEQLLSDWPVTIRRIAETLTIPLSLDATATARIGDFLEPTLRHHRGTEGFCSSEQLSQLASAAYALSCSTAENRLGDALVPFAEEAAQICRLALPWISQAQETDQANRKLEIENARLSNANSCLQAEVARVKSTVSWRITAPLRVIWNALRQLGQAGR
jgi:hypothetical protein